MQAPGSGHKDLPLQQQQQQLQEAAGSQWHSPPSGSLGSSSAGTAVAATAPPTASPMLAVLATTARELLHEIEAAAADSPASVAPSSGGRSSRRKGHKSSKRSSRSRHKQQEQQDEHALAQLAQEHGQEQYPAAGAACNPPFQYQQAHLQEALWQQQSDTQLGTRVSTADSVGWSAVLQKYEQHKMHMAQLLTEIDKHQQQQQATEHLLSTTAAAAAPAALTTPAVAAPTSPTAHSSRSGWSSRRRQEAGAEAGAASAAVALQSAVLDPGLRLRIQQLRGSGSDGCDGTGRPAGPAAAAAAGAAAAWGAHSVGAAAGLPALLSTGAVAGFTAAAGDGGAVHAELAFLLAERHLAAALLKHLAAVVAADAATAAAAAGRSSETQTAGEPHSLWSHSLVRVPARICKGSVIHTGLVAMNKRHVDLCLACGTVWRLCAGGALGSGMLHSPSALLDAACDAVAAAEAQLDQAWLHLPPGVCVSCCPHCELPDMCSQAANRRPLHAHFATDNAAQLEHTCRLCTAAETCTSLPLLFHSACVCRQRTEEQHPPHLKQQQQQPLEPGS